MAPKRDADTGREELAQWKSEQPDNYYLSDSHLISLLTFYWGKKKLSEISPRLEIFGGQTATLIDAAVIRANLPENLPRLERFSAIGARTETIIHPRDHDLAGAYIYGSGAMSVYAEPGNNLLALTLFFLSSYNGEAGHNCPLACTAGVIKTLQNVGSESLKERYLPRLLDPDYQNRYHGAQYLTEVQGGSDVGANSCIATPANDAGGAWMLNGEKWFCSNAGADVALVTARLGENSASGTKGLGLFLVPRVKDDGELNGIYLRRLKDKLGTRSLATAEIDFEDALCFPIGDPGQGFQHAMDFVVNTSRLYNAVGSAGAARRAQLIAAIYAQYRHAFGGPIARFPLIAEALAEMRSETMAIVSGSMFLAHVRDQLETGSGDDQMGAFFRLAINLNKYRASQTGTCIIRRAIEVLGGNGAMENFSVLPRLLRDSIIFETWEGAHNTLLAQCLRDIERLNLHHSFGAFLSDIFAKLRHSVWRERGMKECQRTREEIDRLKGSDEDRSVFFRPLADRMMNLMYVACLSQEAEWEEANQHPHRRRPVVDLLWQHIASDARANYMQSIKDVAAII